MTEDRTQRPYLLYVPSNYSERRTWPLLVVCQGTWPYDTAEWQMREWALFGENHGIIVAAPKLLGVKGDFPPPPTEQIALQRQDEQAILNMVATLKARYRIAEEQVFMTGWSAGAYAILHTGLRNPDVFRALAIRQGTFDARFMDVPAERMDRWQPIKVVHGSTDFLRDQTKSSVQWLRDNNLYVEEEEIPGTHRRIDPSRVWKFFAQIARERPWVRISARAVGPDSPLSVRFELKAIPPATKQKWFFGDGADSREPTPVHTYSQPGRYEVAVNVALKGGKMYTRKRVIVVGQAAPP
jgi:pimeloyl-ACP methyl ester carboxylesterase